MIETNQKLEIGKTFDVTLRVEGVTNSARCLDNALSLVNLDIAAVQTSLKNELTHLYDYVSICETDSHAATTFWKNIKH